MARWTPAALNTSSQVGYGDTTAFATLLPDVLVTTNLLNCEGEIKGGKVSGFHNWIQFYLLEKRGALNYYSHSFNGPVGLVTLISP